MLELCSVTLTFPKLYSSGRATFSVSFQLFQGVLPWYYPAGASFNPVSFGWLLLLAVNSFSNLVSKDIFGICGEVRGIHVLKSSHCPITSSQSLIFFTWNSPARLTYQMLRSLLMFSCLPPLVWSSVNQLIKRCFAHVFYPSPHSPQMN